MARLPVWRREFLVVLGLLVLASVVGFSSGYPSLVFCIALSVLLLRHYSALYRAHRWLRDGVGNAPPRGIGVWSEIFDVVQRLYQSSRKRKRKLSRLLKGFKEAMSALPDGAIVLDKELKTQWWNPEAERLFGLENPESSERRIDELISSHEFSLYLERGDFDQPLETRSPLDLRVCLSIRIVPYGKGQNLLQVRDVTRLHELEMVRKDFVANASHELRNPLTVVLGYLETLKDSNDLASGQWVRAFEQMYQQANRVKGIVNDMLMLSAVESETPQVVAQRFDVRSMLDSLKDEAGALSAGRRHRIGLYVEGDTFLEANPDEIRSAFSNRISNAVRYTPEQGRIDQRWWIDREGAHFSVSDSGIGIEPVHIPRLTERFYRVDKARSRETGGTGLGLAIVKHALGRAGGHLTIESTPHIGSTFTCHFPYRSLAVSAA